MGKGTASDFLQHQRDALFSQDSQRHVHGVASATCSTFPRLGLYRKEGNQRLQSSYTTSNRSPRPAGICRKTLTKTTCCILRFYVSMEGASTTAHTGMRADEKDSTKGQHEAKDKMLQDGGYVGYWFTGTYTGERGSNPGLLSKTSTIRPRGEQLRANSSRASGSQPALLHYRILSFVTVKDL